MTRLSRDSYVAVFLLLVAGVFFWASFDIRQPDYGVLMPSTWPRIIIGVLAFLSVIYLIQSLRAPSEDTVEGGKEDDLATPGLGGFFAYWRNPIICFATFLGFLVTLPVLGSLIGGVAFVFVLLGFLGGWSPRQLAVHALVAIGAVGGMWAVFTFGLGVLLPTGMIYNPFAI